MLLRTGSVRSRGGKRPRLHTGPDEDEAPVARPTMVNLGHRRALPAPARSLTEGKLTRFSKAYSGF